MIKVANQLCGDFGCYLEVPEQSPYRQAHARISLQQLHNPLLFRILSRVVDNICQVPNGGNGRILGNPLATPRMSSFGLANSCVGQMLQPCAIGRITVRETREGVLSEFLNHIGPQGTICESSVLAGQVME